MDMAKGSRKDDGINIPSLTIIEGRYEGLINDLVKFPSADTENVTESCGKYCFETVNKGWIR